MVSILDSECKVKGPVTLNMCYGVLIKFYLIFKGNIKIK